MALKSKRVFISYAWENDAYRERVKFLAARLRQDGVNARLDAWHLNELTIPEFMASEVRNAEKILILCSPQYRTKVHAMEDGQGVSGSGWEAMLVTSALWTRRRKRGQIIGVLFSGTWQEASPDFLSGLPFLDLRDHAQFEDNYGDLLRNLTDQREQAPALGAPLELKPNPIKPLRGPAQTREIPTQPCVALVSNAAVPRQLPPPPPDFVGRKIETTKLVNAVREAGATILGVRGIGGIGKTALALAVADTLAVDFSVGQIYLDLKGAQHKEDSLGVRPLSTAEAMDHVIRSFNPSASAPTTDAEREGLYRTILNGKRVLLLMDNTLNAQQVERLAPPAGCLMIVTAREHFILPGISAENLPVLPPEDAHELLLRIAPNVGSYAIKLAKLCGYLPEGLRTAASALASAPNLSPADFLRRMNSARRRLSLTGIELSLATSSELLNDRLRDRWFQLGLFPATFDESAAAAIWQTSNREARNTLTSLLRYSLVEFDSKHSRYYLHDLVRDFTLSRLDPSTLEFVRFRHSKYYSEILAAADYLYFLGDVGVSLGQEMSDTEWINIESGQRWAAAHASGSEDSAQLCLRYSEAGENVLPVRLTTLEQIAWLTAGADSVQFLTKPRPGRRAVFESEVVVLRNLANAHLARGEVDRAAELFQQSINRLQDLHADYAGIYETRGFGDILRASGKYTKALKLHYEALLWIGVVKTFPVNLFPFNNPRELIKAESCVQESLGDDYLALREGVQAIKCFRKQLRLAEKSEDRRAQLRALGRLGRAYKSIHKYERAMQFQERSLAIAEELRDKEGQANAFFNTALTLVALEDRTAAIARAETALTIYEQIESPLADDVRCALQEWHGDSMQLGQQTS